MAADSGRLREVYDPAHTGSGRDPSDTSYRVAKRDFWTVFGTAPLPTGTPVASPRGEGEEIGTVDGIKVGFTTGFGTGTLPTSTSVASRRGEGVFWTVSIRSFIDDYADPSARLPCPQVPQCHPRVAKRDFWPVFGPSGGQHIQRTRRIRCARPARLHIQRPGMSRTLLAPAYSVSSRRFSRARRRRGCRLCPSHRRGCCRSGWRGWSG